METALIRLILKVMPALEPAPTRDGPLGDMG